MKRLAQSLSIILAMGRAAEFPVPQQPESSDIFATIQTAHLLGTLRTNDFNIPENRQKIA
jgi:hypothetical protein